MTRSIVLLVALSLGGCYSANSSYQRSTATPSELTWAFDGELTVTQNGRVVADSSWSGLSDALHCVPEAADLAATARSKKLTGKTLVAIGGLIGIASIAGGTYLALSDEDNVGTGLAILGGGTAVFAVTAITGALMIAGSDPRAIDAVNIYNDSYAGRAGCATGR